ncbi:MAG: polyphosphate polymerase domain-containing protein [Clostridiales bacterium]|nr:polyphosphate polymerase domain-containing protein [Clostridiales bacterium]
MSNICVFKRYEYKYLLTAEQYFAVLTELDKHMIADKHGKSTIQSLYYDTDDFLLVRRSLEKPIYKEKLRLRSYGQAKGDDEVFLELKKKYDGVVFKRRIQLTAADAERGLFDYVRAQKEQIAKEITYAVDLYKTLAPRVLLLYDRTAYFGEGTESDLRVTFDTNIRYRTDRLTLSGGTDGTPVRSDGKILMEVKAGTSIPMWLCRLISANGIRKTSFSKYGSAYSIERNKQLTEVKQVG